MAVSASCVPLQSIHDVHSPVCVCVACVRVCVCACVFSTDGVVLIDPEYLKERKGEDEY